MIGNALSRPFEPELLFDRISLCDKRAGEEEALRNG